MYRINVDGLDIMIEVEKTDNRDWLLKYYNELISAKGVILEENQNKALQSLINHMTEDSAKKKKASIKERQVERISAYVDAISKLTKQQEQTVDALLEVIDAIVEDPEQEAIMINGNKFLYERGSIDLKKYADKLAAIGNKQKGNTWSIYVDDEGELVIY